MFSAFSSVNLKVIPFSEIKGVQVGNAWDDKAKTGVTVFYFPSPATAAVKIFGGGPASRETPLLEPERNSLPLNALVFGGGSAYGLAAADGVMRRMEEIGAGFDTGYGIVPIVCQSDIFDLSYGDGSVRPDREMGYLAASRAVNGNDPHSGATLGKPYGMARAIRPVFTMWDGDTIYAVSAGSDKVPAEINAVGTLAARVMEAAIVDAVRSSSVSESEYLSNI